MSHPSPWLTPGRGKRCLQLCAALMVALLAFGTIPGAASYLAGIVRSTLPFLMPFLSGEEVLHSAMYGFLAVLIQLAVARHHTLLTLSSIALLGLLDETYQHFTPHRSATLSDWLTNMTAAAVVCCVFAAWRMLAKLWAASRAGNASSPSTQSSTE